MKTSESNEFVDEAGVQGLTQGVALRQKQAPVVVTSNCARHGHIEIHIMAVDFFTAKNNEFVPHPEMTRSSRKYCTSCTAGQKVGRRRE